MRQLRTRMAEERGMALVMALGVMMVLTISVTSVMLYTGASSGSARYSKAKAYAYPLAENGVNEAMAVLRLPTNNALDPSVFCTSSTQTQPCTTTTQYDGGTSTWYGTLNTNTGVWTITSTGTIAQNPTGPQSSAVTRTLTVSVAVHPTLTQPLNTPIWNYIYATHPASAPGTCDMTLSNSVSIASPLYVAGNLCLLQTSHIDKGPLVIGGQLSLDSKTQNYVGTSSVKLSDAHIANGCVFGKNNAADIPCKNNGLDGVWATVLDATPPTSLTPPTVDWNKWYVNGSPGPYFACQTINGVAPYGPYPVFDTPVAATTADNPTKLTYMNDNQGTQNLTPTSSYDCQTFGGELKWDSVNHLLTIKGTIFIDGNAYIQNGAVNRYSGQGVIYLRGTFLMKNSSLCGAIYNGACDTRTPANGGWDPNANLIAFIAHSTGGQVNTGDSIQVISGSLQGAAYADGNIELDTSSSIDGPMVGSTVILGQSVSTSFPSITTVPDGMPSNPTAYALADPPGSYSG